MAANLPQSELQRFIRPSEIGRLATFVCGPYAAPFKVHRFVWMEEWFQPFTNEVTAISGLHGQELVIQ